ncbi:MAG: ABC transporter ATP-binding protein [Bifidobacteriaceae bacterium]|jgi:branched-chain amino acid transport system ATP-binding protein|nr:ABC transporter ATP-binding protein [Bifidobacteriaceae bacterium]
MTPQASQASAAAGLVLSVKDLSVSYGAVAALQDLSLEVAQGELVSLLGVNGAGKSTTLKAIAGVLKPTHGAITFQGQPIGGKTAEAVHKLGISLVPEGRQIFPMLTVAENLRIGAFGSYKAGSFAEDLEDMFQLFPILKQRYRQAGGLLSGGEQQMLAIARGLMARPKLLMLDEPSLGLSPTLVDQIFDLILSLKQRGITILLVEQNAERALQLADRAYLLSTGRVRFAGRPAEMSTQVDIAAVYLGEHGAVGAAVPDGAPAASASSATPGNPAASAGGAA